jgi:hypothetical protein
MTNTGEVVAKRDPDLNRVASSLRDEVFDIILFEISSATFYRESPKAIYHTARWALWNMAMAGELAFDIGHLNLHTQLRVSPSSKWTLGHPLKTRHAIAKCVQPQKDLRECEAMIFFYQHNPEQWCSLPDYLANI